MPVPLSIPVVWRDQCSKKIRKGSVVCFIATGLAQNTPGLGATQAVVRPLGRGPNWAELIPVAQLVFDPTRKGAKSTLREVRGGAAARWIGLRDPSNIESLI